MVADRRPGADRPGADHAPEGHAREPPEPDQGLRRRDLRRPGARRGRRPGPATRRASARRVAERLARRTRPSALKGTALVNQALLGTEPHDLSKLIAGTQKTSAKLVTREEALKDLITNFNRTTAAFAAEQANLRQTIALLPRVLEQANPALDALNRVVPAHARVRARDPAGRPRDPGHDRRVVPLDRADARARLARRAAGPGRATCARPSPTSRRVTDDTIELLPQVDLVNRCCLDVLLPTGDVEDRGRLPDHRPRELQGVLAVDGRRSRASRRTSTATAATRASRPAAAPTRCRPAASAPAAGRHGAAVHRQLPAPADRHAPRAPGRPSRRSTARRRATRRHAARPAARRRMGVGP